MINQDMMRQLPTLEEFKFPSKVPIVGPLVSLIRRLLYNLTAKWGVWFVIQQQNRINQMIDERLRQQEALFGFVIQQQNRINQMIDERLRQQEALLVDLDRDLTLLARRVAEIEVYQRQLLRMFQSQSNAGSLTTPGE